MTPAAIERVFGRTRLQMVTGRYVEVFREQAVTGERRRYTKRFLSTTEGDFREWTEREWRLLSRLFGHGVRCVPEVVQYDRGSTDGGALVQTYDAGVTIDHWETLIPVQRHGHVLRHVFEDCAHWWALAHHFLLALKEIHRLQLVHLDIKADNVCVPLAPHDFLPHVGEQVLRVDFGRLALIDFAFSLVSGERLTRPLPIGWQRHYAYQSPRLLKALVAGRQGDLEPTCRLDWRCDLFSLAAMLKRYMPAPQRVSSADRASGWTNDRHTAARSLIARIDQIHDGEEVADLPHDELIESTARPLRETDLAASLQRGWSLSDGSYAETEAATVPATPVTLIEPRVAPLTLVDAAEFPDVDGPLPGPATRFAGHASAAEVATPRHRRLHQVAAASALAAAALLVVSVTREGADTGTAAASGGGRSADAVPDFPADPQPSTVRVSIAKAASPTTQPLPPLPPTSSGATTTTPLTGVSVTRADAANVELVQAPPQPPLHAAVDAARATGRGEVRDDLLARADDIVANTLPALAEHAANQLAPVLLAAASAESPDDDAGIVRMARSLAPAPDLQRDVQTGNRPSGARQLNAAARDAFWARGDVAGALRLQSRAFGANPQDPEVVGNLAFYYLKASPPQPEIARRLALHALSTSTGRSGTARSEDWGNLAVANALVGRQQDATHALFMLLAASRNVDRTCRSALSAVASYGPSMQAPVQAMLARVQARGQAAGSAFCAWPPRWDAGHKYP